MTSICTMISFVVLLLATYSYSAPILTEIENSTYETTVENSTNIMQEKRTGNTVETGDSSSSEEVTTVYPTTDEYETSTVDESTMEMKQKREDEEETSTDDELTTESTQKRQTEGEIEGETGAVDELTTELNQEREIEDETNTVDDLTTEINQKRETEVEAETNTVDDLTTEINQKREVDDETTTDEMTTVEPTSETNMERRGQKLSFDSLESIESPFDFNRRAIGSIQSVESVESTTVDEIEQETSTYEVPSSSSDRFAQTTGLVGEEQSSTSEYETTVEPIEESSSVSSGVEMENSTKIIAVIPGRIAKTEIVVNPVKVVPVTVQKQLSQGQNQSIIEETKSDQ